MDTDLFYIKKVVEEVDGGYKINDEILVPKDEKNRHYLLIQKWIKEGREVIPYVPPSPEEELERYRSDLKVSPLQFRRALRKMEYMERVKAYMETAPEEIEEAWDYATIIPRLDPLVEAIKNELGLTDKEMDDLFELALTFP